MVRIMNEAWLEKMEEYFSRKMSPEEQLLFESELETNKELASAFNVYKTIVAEMHIDEKYKVEEARLRRTLEDLNARYLKKGEDQKSVKSTGKEQIQEKPYGKVKKINWWMSAGVAASLIGIIVLGIVWYLNKEKKDSSVVIVDQGTDSLNNLKKPDTSFQQKNIPPNPVVKQESSKSSPAKKIKYKIDNLKRQALFAANFRVDSIPDDMPDTLQQALAYYQSKNYKNAITAFEILHSGLEERGYEEESKQRTIFYARYYKALSYLAQGRAEKAIPELKIATAKSPDESWKNKAQWNLALAWLKTGNSTKAEVLLKQVAGNSRSGAYRQKALRLISDLEKN